MKLTRLGKYEIRGLIGRGTSGSVYRAWDPQIERDVAIKVVPRAHTDDLDIEKYTRFQQEARAAGRLHHPNIVSTYDFGETDDFGYIVMELLAGPSLQTALARRTHLPLPATLTVMRGLLAGLQHSHARNVVHRDIKPANLVFTDEGEVKISDFGVAHLESSNLTRIGSQIGTPAYMAPEQVLGEAVDARSDLYSAGVVLFEMLTGRRPFEGSTASILHKIVSAPPPSPSDFLQKVSPRFDAVLATVLAKAPEERYQTARAFADALPPTLEADGGSAPEPDDLDATLVQARVLPHSPPLPPPQVPTAPQAPRKMPTAIVAGVVALAVAGGAAAYLLLSPANTVRTAEAPVVSAPPSQAPVSPPPPAAPVETATSRPAAAPSPPDATAALRLAAAGALAAAPCSLLLAEIEPDRARLRGVTALGEASDLSVQAAVNQAFREASGTVAVTWQVARAQGPYCGVLGVLQSARAADRLPPAILSFVPAVGSPARVVANVPGRSTVLVDVFPADGTVRHLGRRIGVTAAVVIDAPGLTAPAGRPGNGIVSVVAFDAPPGDARPDGEAASAYLAALKPVLDDARARGVAVVTDALAIDVDKK